MLRPRRAFTAALISITMLTGISGCLDSYEHDYGGPEFTYKVSLRNTNGSGYIIVPFPYNENDHENSTNFSLDSLQNIISYSIESTIYGIALNISFVGDFNVYYREIVSPDDFRVSGENPMSLRDEVNSTRHYQYSWIYYHGVEGAWLSTGYVYMIREKSINYGDVYSSFIGSRLVNGWQVDEYQSDFNVYD